MQKKNALTCHPRWGEALSKEWDYEKNVDINTTLEELTYASHRKVWWQCKNGHQWMATIANRVKGKGCPYCSGRKPIVGLSDLETANPNLAAEWHPTKNGELAPREVSTGSQRIVWWLGKCGHEWRARIKNRNRGDSCPYCAGKCILPGVNDMASTHPSIAAEWHPTKNGTLTPNDVTRGSHVKAWWKCARGHEWQAQVYSRTSGKGCPYCANQLVLAGSNDMASTHPSIAAEWHPTKNGAMTPNDITQGSHVKAWWKCARGHEWQAQVSNRTKGSGCPYCANKAVLTGYNDMATTNPRLSEEWHPTQNGKLTAQDVLERSNKKAWWKCAQGHEWSARLIDRSNGCSCPICSISRGEKYVIEWANSAGFIVEEQWKHEDCRDIRVLPFDVMLYRQGNDKLEEIALIEYDGEQHSNPNTFFASNLRGTGETRYEYIRRHDKIKDVFCEKTGRLLIRVPYTINDQDAIGNFIEQKLMEHGLPTCIKKHPKQFD